MRTVLVAVLAAVALAGCSPEPDVSSSPVESPTGTATKGIEGSARAEPRTVEAAKATAQRFFDAYAAGDWAGHWDDWTAAGKAAFSRADYVKYRTECKAVTGLKFVINSARLEGTDLAVLNVERGGILRTYEVHYESGQWRYQPDADALAGYRLGVTKLIAQNKAKGTCV